MATATVGSAASSQHLNHLHAESIPVVDLRLLSQTELFSLSLCSSSTSSLCHLQNDNDVSTPKIDRSVFNESAGSRKQTFSRLRLAPRSTSQFAQSSSNYRLSRPIPAQSAEKYLDEENSQILSLLKSLFGADSYADVEENENDSNLVSVPVQFQDYVCLPSTRDVELRNAPVGVVSSKIANYGSGKRKRGRPRKNENNVSYYGNAINQAIRCEDKETECKMVENAERGNNEGEEMAMVNKNGMVVDLAAVRNAANTYEEELRRRTEGLKTETELLGFLEGLEGQWMGKRKKRRIVDASTFGDVLPMRWKLVLCLQRRTGHFWLSIRRYISPNGQQFMSYEDVLSHLLSFCNLQGESKAKYDHFDDGKQLPNKVASGNVTGLTVRGDKDGAVLSLMFPSTSMSTEHEELASSLMTGRTSDVQIGKKYKCHKCTMAFDEEDDLLQHLVLSHQREPKRFRSGISLTEEVIIKNQKYECQCCHKTSEERHCYNGHLGNHIKDHLKRVEASGGVSRAMPASVRAHSDISGTQESIGIEKDSVAIASIVKTSDETRFASPLCKKQESAAVVTHNDKQGIVYNISNGRVEKTNEVTDAVAAETMFGSVAESALLDIKNNIMLKSSNETDSFNSTIYGTGNFDSQKKGLQDSLASPRRVQACIVDNNLDQVGDQNIEDMPMSGAIEDVKIDSRNSVEKDEPIMGLGNYPTVQEGAVTSITENFLVYGSVNKETQSINSTGRDSKEASFSYVNEKGFVFSNNLANISTSVINECNFDEIAKSGDNEQTAGVGRVVPAPIENIMGSYGSCLVNQYSKEKMHLVENDVEEKIKFTMKKTYQQKSEKIQHTFFGRKQMFCLKNNEVKVSNKLMEVPKQVPWSKKSGCSSGSGLVTGSETNIDMVKSSSSSITVPSTNEQVFLAEDSEVCNRTLEKPMLERSLGSNLYRQPCDGKIYGGDNNMNKDSRITLEEHQHKEDRAFFNDEVHTAFGDGHTKKDVDVVTSSVKGTCSKGYSLTTCGNQQPFATEDNEAGPCSCSMDYLKSERGCVEDLLCFLGTKVKVIEDNGHFSCTNQEKPRSEDLGSSRSNEFMINFDRHESHDQPKEIVSPNFMWRTDGENDIVLGLAPSSSLPVQSPGCLATRDLLSGKWQDKDEILHGRFTDVSDTEKLSLGSMGNIECNLLTSQTSPCADGSKVSSNDAEIAQGFDLSIWHEKGVLPLLPTEKNSCFVTTVCAGCRNEFYHEAFETKLQMGSMSFICAVCKGQAL
uniref:C2H2-type domain-containing protein n=2 Tax=Rhizophora mucronata TaxID=61149 RepID=A0A2P2IV94_RHIMU